ncbi:HTH-type transcriptional regulator SinR [Desulfosporosinus acididurans]|uniref:HTH-type transcriptional regulator SinR n=1 Tax=Desulfosporosinus acididurans TaxID=476652 RepID=A0A0J1IGB7_9FIRM|nr:helix-turn-helix transcriptional regulator [Desulfosporosinus acididurans]KLU63771.1 HTH-type transcriptional regulator SinR [Desulfosporosinus acididurans]
MRVGESLKTYRKQKGFTQVELAKKAGISRSYLADVEAGRYNPSLDTLTAVAKALNIETGLLISPEAIVVRREDEAMKALLSILKAIYDYVELEFINSGSDEVSEYDGEYQVLLTKDSEKFYLSKKQYESLYKFVVSNIPNYIDLINSYD